MICSFSIYGVYVRDKNRLPLGNVSDRMTTTASYGVGMLHFHELAPLKHMPFRYILMRDEVKHLNSVSSF